MAKQTAENLVDVARMAQEFGCSERQVQLYVQAGMPKAGHGKYDLLPCFRWYAQKLKDKLNEAREKAGDLEYEQMRERRATANIKELEFAEKQKQLIPLDVYKQHVAAQFITVRQNILALAAKIAPQLEGLDRTEVKARLHKAHCDTLAALATGEALNHALGNGSDSADKPSGNRESRTSATDARSSSGAEAGKPGASGAAGAPTRRKPKRMGRKKPGAKKGHK